MRITCSFMLFLVLAGSSLFAAKTLDIYFIDADLGNAVLVVTPSGQAMMLDTGAAGEKYINRIMTVIQKAGVKQLDYVIVSHYHWDHYGTVPELCKKIPILHYVDHGPDVDLNCEPYHYEKYGGVDEKQFHAYDVVRQKGNHMVAKAGDRIPLKDVDVQIVASSGDSITKPLPGGGAPNQACAITQPRTDDDSEDGQSVCEVITYGKFRYADFGDLTWNKSYRLFCPNNMVGTVDLYLITHHGIEHELKEAGIWNWGRAGDPPAEVHGMRPRAAVLSSGEDYVGRLSNGPLWQTVRNSPGLEDIWQTHYQVQGGKQKNAPEQFIANMSVVNDQGHYIKVSAEADGSFTMTNSRNGFTKRYAARKEAHKP